MHNGKHPNIKAFIEVNHHLMTIKEMAEETGYTHAQVWKMCKDLNLKPISDSDRKKEFIQSHAHLSAKEIAYLLKCHVTYVHDLAVQMGVELKSIWGAANIESDRFIDNINEQDKEDLYRITGHEMFKKNKIPKRKHHSAIYNQTGSKLLDEVRGITTTERNDKLI